MSAEHVIPRFQAIEAWRMIRARRECHERVQSNPIFGLGEIEHRSSVDPVARSARPPARRVEADRRVAHRCKLTNRKPYGNTVNAVLYASCESVVL